MHTLTIILINTLHAIFCFHILNMVTRRSRLRNKKQDWIFYLIFIGAFMIPKVFFSLIPIVIFSIKLTIGYFYLKIRYQEKKLWCLCAVLFSLSIIDILYILTVFIDYPIVLITKMDINKPAYIMSIIVVFFIFAGSLLFYKRKWFYGCLNNISPIMQIGLILLTGLMRFCYFTVQLSENKPKAIHIVIILLIVFLMCSIILIVWIIDKRAGHKKIEKLNSVLYNDKPNVISSDNTILKIEELSNCINESNLLIQELDLIYKQNNNQKDDMDKNKKKE